MVKGNLKAKKWVTGINNQAIISLISIALFGLWAIASPPAEVRNDGMDAWNGYPDKNSYHRPFLRINLRWPFKAYIKPLKKGHPFHGRV